MKWTLWLIVALLVLLPAYSATFTVDFNQIAIVKTFGRAGDPIDGATDAGLHFKWPWPVQDLVRYDGRTFVFEDTIDQLQTQDKQNVLATIFCAWRIRDANHFLRAVEKIDLAEQALRKLARSTKNDVVGKYPLSRFLNTDPKQMRIPEIEQEVLAAVRKTAAEQYGIEVVTLGIKSFGLPEDVTDQVIQSMIEERKRFAAQHRARGKSYADLIRTRAKTAADNITTFARARAEDIRIEGWREAGKYLEQFQGNEALAIFLRRLEFLKEALKDNAVFVGSGEIDPALEWFRTGPTLKSLKKQADAGPMAVDGK